MGFPADWDKHGKAAGPIRNTEMIEDGRPDVVIAFTYDLPSSKGTADTVKKAKKAHIPVFVYPYTDDWYGAWKRLGQMKPLFKKDK